MGGLLVVEFLAENFSGSILAVRDGDSPRLTASRAFAAMERFLLGGIMSVGTGRGK